jgi:hypothetical protein
MPNLLDEVEDLLSGLEYLDVGVAVEGTVLQPLQPLAAAQYGEAAAPADLGALYPDNAKGHSNLERKAKSRLPRMSPYG